MDRPAATHDLVGHSLPRLSLTRPIVAFLWRASTVVAAAGQTQGTFNAGPDLLDDKPTRELFGFVARALKK